MRATIPILLALAAGGQTPPAMDISGTWVAKAEGPMGEMEFVFVLKMAKDGKLMGTQRMPFGDAPLVGQVNGVAFTFAAEIEFFGNVSRRESQGRIVGDAIEITPAVPGPPPGMGPGGPGGAPGGGPGDGRRVLMGPLTARRGEPAPSYRAASIDFKALPKVELPAIRKMARNGLAKTPPMGWNSWNKFRAKIDDRTIREIADAMVTSGMRDAGYVYVNIDDGWQDKRDAQGVLQPNPGFPDMKALAAYVHGKGLKLGIYSSPGPTTCGGFTGSYGHEEIDAKTWAEWGIDYLKYDWCSASRVWKDEDMHAVYQRMAEAIEKTRRPMVYALCQYGRAKVGEWGPQVAANLWRTTFDIRDQWASMAGIGFAQHDWAQYAAPGQWNDPDMLEIGNGGMTQTEYRTHFSLWAMVAAPLLAGHDVRTMTPEVREILLNKEVIAVDQDKLGKGGSRVGQQGETEVWLKPLEKGQYAVALFNRGTAESPMTVKWGEMKLTAKEYRVRDLWARADLGKKKEFTTVVPAHGVVMLRLTR